MQQNMSTSNLYNEMRTIILFAVCFLTSQACSSYGGKSPGSKDNSVNNPVDSSKNYTVTTIKKEDFDNYSKEKALGCLTDTSIIKKQGDSLAFIADNGKKVVLKDSLWDSFDTEKRKFNYEGYLAESNGYIVMAKYYESSEVLLINKSDGNITKLWDIPKLSPDKKYIVCRAGFLGYDIMPNGLQLWKIDKNSIVHLFDIEPKTWEPHDVRWIGGHTLILLQKVPAEFSKTKKVETNYLKIDIKE